MVFKIYTEWSQNEYYLYKKVSHQKHNTIVVCDSNAVKYFTVNCKVTIIVTPPLK